MPNIVPAAMYALKNWIIIVCGLENVQVKKIFVFSMRLSSVSLSPLSASSLEHSAQKLCEDIRK